MEILQIYLPYLFQKEHMNKNDELLTLADAAKFLHYSQTTLYRMVADKKIVYYKPNRKILFYKADLEEYLSKSKVECA